MSPSANAGSIKAIQAARAQARYSHAAGNHRQKDEDDEDDVEVVSKPKKRGTMVTFCHDLQQKFKQRELGFDLIIDFL